MRLRWIISGALLSVILVFMFLFLIAAAEYFTSLGENTAGILVYITTAIAVFIGAIFAVRKSGTKALFHAMAVALILILAIVVVSVSVNGRVNTDIHCISMITGILLSAFLAAVVGRN